MKRFSSFTVVLSVFLLFFIVYEVKCFNHEYQKRSLREKRHDTSEVVEDPAPFTIPQNSFDVSIQNVSSLVQLYHRQKNLVFCLGVILSEDWILTGAHCLHDQQEDNVRVVTGTNIIYSNYSRQKLHKVDELVKPLQFDINVYEHDVGLIKLKNRLKFNNKQNAASIRSKPLERNEYLKIYGFGLLNGILIDRPQGRLESTVVPVVDTEYCQRQFYSSLAFPDISKNMFCAGTENGAMGVPTCAGVSGGGPAFDHEKKLVGISSWGVDCIRRTPMVFCNVVRYRKWIKDQTHIESININDEYPIFDYID